MTRDDSAAKARVEAARGSDGSPHPGPVPDDLRDLVPPPCSSPTVSIVTACHDDGRYLLDALASVRLCADEGIEVIVADDASTDPFTRQVLSRIAELGVTVVPAEGVGPSAARNAALAASSADLVLPLDADNLLRPGYIPAAVAVLDADPSVAVVHADAMRFGLVADRWVAPTVPIADLLCGNQLDTCAVIRRTALDKVGGWNADLNGSEDWALWVAMAADGFGFATVPIVGWDYRMRAGSLRSTLTPSVRRRHLSLLVEAYPDLYRAHTTDVIANFAGALEAADVAQDALAFQLRRLDDRIAALEGDLAESQRFAATARRQRAESNRVAQEAERVADQARELADEAVTRAEAADERARHAEYHLEVFQQTKLVQWTSRPRAVYQRLRNLGRRPSSGSD